MGGMYLMLDVVVNKMAFDGSPEKVEWGFIQRLNKEEDYHPYCSIDYTNRTSTLEPTSPTSQELTEIVLDGT